VVLHASADEVLQESGVMRLPARRDAVTRANHELKLTQWRASNGITVP